MDNAKMENRNRLCVLCYKPASSSSLPNSQKFIRLFSRYLKVHWKFENPLKDEFLCCDDCSRLENAFCELFCQLETVQLQLNWKLRQIFETMLCAGRVPSRYKAFQNQFEICDNGMEVYGEIRRRRKNLIKNCKLKLKSSQPKVYLRNILGDCQQFETEKLTSKEIFEQKFNPESIRKETPLQSSELLSVMMSHVVIMVLALPLNTLIIPEIKQHEDLYCSDLHEMTNSSIDDNDDMMHSSLVENELPKEQASVVSKDLLQIKLESDIETFDNDCDYDYGPEYYSGDGESEQQLNLDIDVGSTEMVRVKCEESEVLLCSTEVDTYHESHENPSSISHEDSDTFNLLPGSASAHMKRDKAQINSRVDRECESEVHFGEMLTLTAETELVAEMDEQGSQLKLLRSLIRCTKCSKTFCSDVSLKVHLKYHEAEQEREVDFENEELRVPKLLQGQSHVSEPITPDSTCNLAGFSKENFQIISAPLSNEVGQHLITKRGRGRPRKYPKQQSNADSVSPQRKRGRPRIHPMKKLQRKMRIQCKFGKLKKDYNCDLCGKSFSRAYIKQHNHYHHNPNYVDGKCTLCALPFATAHDFYINHWVKVHRGRKDPNTNYPCESCGACFRSNKGILVHKYHVHGDGSLKKKHKSVKAHVKLKETNELLETDKLENAETPPSHQQSDPNATQSDSIRFSAGFQQDNSLATDCNPKPLAATNLISKQGRGRPRIHLYICELCGNGFRGNKGLLIHKYHVHGDRSFKKKTCNNMKVLLKRQENDELEKNEVTVQSQQELEVSPPPSHSVNISAHLQQENPLAIGSKLDPIEMAPSLNEIGGDLIPKRGRGRPRIHPKKIKPVEPPPQRQYSCESCGKGFRRKWGYLKHKYHVHGEGILKIYFNKMASNENKIKKCYENTTPLYDCYRCEKQFDKPEALNTHVKVDHPESYFPCSRCSVLKYTKTSLKLHNNNCETPLKVRKKKKKLKKPTLKKAARKLNCEICDRPIGLISLKRHYYVVHGVAEEDFKCLKCSKTFLQRENWVAHMETEHLVHLNKIVDFVRKYNVNDRSNVLILNPQAGQSNQFPKIPKGFFQCCHCGQTFMTKGFLDCHISDVHKTVVIENEFECKTCNEKFGSDYLMKLHSKLHKKENDNGSFKCGRCPLIFDTRTKFYCHIYFAHTRSNSWKWDHLKKQDFPKTIVATEQPSLAGLEPGFLTGSSLASSNQRAILPGRTLPPSEPKLVESLTFNDDNHQGQQP